ncbi:MAG TPA: NADP oxidoreductase [Actinobacteria bacterium]|nr:NADP oxidoreductase [Actinomycetota bacterium]
MARPRVATVWLEGCSGCHMSVFDMDERLLELADKMDLVYSPLVDTKEYPENVDVVLVEGGIGNEEQLHFAHTMRERTKIFVSLGDCAITSNIVAYRNPFRVADVIERVFAETTEDGSTRPGTEVPALLPYAVPIHEIIKVDVFIPGCPPSADLIHYVLTELLEGRHPEIRNRFG